MLSRILLQYLPVNIDNKDYCIDLCPKPELVWQAELHKEDILESTKWANIWSYDHLLNWHIKNGYLSSDYQENINSLTSQIKAAKKDLYLAALSAKGDYTDPHLKKMKRALDGPNNNLKAIQSSLLQIQAKSREGLAEDAAEDFILLRSFVDPESKKRITAHANLLDLAKYEILRTFPSSEKIRQIARENSTQLLFGVKKGRILPKYPNELQLMLVSYVNMYKGILKDPECPPQFILNDDDALDGWLLNRGKSSTDDNVPASVKNRENVFITAETQEEANAIYASNSGSARTMQKARFKELQTKGAVKESEFKKRTQVFK